MFDKWFPKKHFDLRRRNRLRLLFDFFIVGIGFFLGEGFILYSLIRYRRREGKKAKFLPGNTWEQAAWILVPAAIILVFDFWIDFAGAKAYDKIKGCESYPVKFIWLG